MLTFGLIVLGILSFVLFYRFSSRYNYDDVGKLSAAALYNAAHGVVYIFMNLWACFQGYCGMPMLLMSEPDRKGLTTWERMNNYLENDGSIICIAYLAWIALALLLWLFGKKKTAKIKLIIGVFLMWFSFAAVLMGIYTLLAESKSMLINLVGAILALPIGVEYGLEMAWPFLSIPMLLFPNVMKTLANPVQSMREMELEESKEGGSKSEFDLSKMPRIIYDSSNRRWQEQYSGDKLSRTYKSDDGETVIISHAQVSGSTATTNAGNFHWY